MEIQDPIHIHDNKYHGLSFLNLKSVVSEAEAKIILVDQWYFNTVCSIETIQAYLDSNKELYIDSTYEMLESTTLTKISELKNIDKITYFYNTRSTNEWHQLLETLNVKGLTCVPKQYFVDYMDAYTPVHKNELAKRDFLCLNGKLTVERIFLVALLSKYNMLPHGHVSLFDEKSNLFDCLPIYTIVNDSDFSTQAKMFMLSELSKLDLPLTVDTNMMHPEISHSREFNGSIYDAVDFAIVPETTGNISRGEFFVTEKTIKCILTNTKFMAVACPSYIKQLKEYIFKNLKRDISHLTDWCDTSYDKIEHKEERIKKVVEIANSHINK